MSNIERYLVPTNGLGIKPLKDGIILAKKLCKELKKDVILLVPAKEHVLGGDLENILKEKTVKFLLKGGKIEICDGRTMKLESERTFRETLTSYIILGIYPTKKMLDLIDKSKNAAAIIIVPWMMDADEIKEWIRTWNPRILGKESTIQEPLIKNPVVEEAMKMLTSTVNLSTGLTHPSDKACTVELFRLLHKNEEPYDPDSIRAWAVKNGWSPEGADELRRIAKAVLDSRPIRGSNYPCWKSNIIEILRKRAIERKK